MRYHPTLVSEPISSHDGSLRHAGWPGGKRERNSATVTAPPTFPPQLIPKTGGFALKVAGSHSSRTATLLSAIATVAIIAQTPNTKAEILPILRIVVPPCG